MEEIDLKKAVDQFCSKCGKKKRKYIGTLFGTPAVLYKSNCHCEIESVLGRKISLSEKALFDKLQIPFWKLMGLKPKQREIELEKKLKKRNMTYGDYRRERDYYLARQPSALPQFEKHIKKYGRKNEPNTSFQKTS